MGVVWPTLLAVLQHVLEPPIGSEVERCIALVPITSSILHNLQYTYFISVLTLCSSRSFSLLLHHLLLTIRSHKRPMQVEMHIHQKSNAISHSRFHHTRLERAQRLVFGNRSESCFPQHDREQLMPLREISD
ncbi:uncharacterized protein SEPMUDRAFT_146369 [Sphaerulina musiva SO2202]|uniref:Uncharacterized protein n=1 Tax=Sphaerulina musiva (strain SO2202) TaxID=692275 RepID=N1QJE0_SPHMS|nr:uncharacterized protein SEPMUDRAFT_146369 [Sphaerulina musiva SO2202]EMF17310.1 hypothetical protein SEPMUDRAFT_146369 [Sphaerulina musiva SO2202]